MRLAVYAGSFDPITLGHLSVIDRSARLFDRLWVLVAINPTKRSLFSASERVDMIREVTARWPNIESKSTEGYVVEFARRCGAQYLVRGVRGCTDVDAEITLANMNLELAPEIETVFVPAHSQLSEVSSSKVKDLVRGGADVSRYCPKRIAMHLQERLGLGTGGVAHV